MLALPAWGDGCGLISYEGRTGTRLFFRVVQSDTSRAFTIDLESKSARRFELERPVALSGTGERAWFITRVSSDDPVITVFERLASGEAKKSGTIEVPFVPLSFTWTEDAAGRVWLFVEGRQHGKPVVAAYRLFDCAWTLEGVVEGTLDTPRADRSANRVFVGTLVFAAGDAPRRWQPLPPNSDASTDLFPLPDGSLIAIDARKDAWLLRARASEWTALAVPWRGESRAFPELVKTDGPWPAVSWKSRNLSELHVASWRDGEWKTIGILKREDAIEGGGPVLVLGDKVIVVGGCYHFDAEGEWVALTTFDAQSAQSVKVVVQP